MTLLNWKNIAASSPHAFLKAFNHSCFKITSMLQRFLQLHAIYIFLPIGHQINSE